MRAITPLVCLPLCALILAIVFVRAVHAQETDESPRAGRLGKSAGQFAPIYGEADDQISPSHLVVCQG